MRVGIAAPNLSDKELEYATDAIKSTWISSKGKYVKEFEENFADYIGTNYALTTSNGTTALHLALASLNLGPGDEVILPTLTMIACANMIKLCRAKPVFVDSEPRTWNIDPSKIEAKITNKTRAIMVVHLYGHPADMTPIQKIAKKYGIYIIEDAAEAHGATYRGKKVGGIGDIGCFSFYANKIITTGEGGMCVTNNNRLMERMESLRNQGYNKEFRKWLIHDEIGFNYRMTNVQAAIGVAQLERIDEFLKIHRDNAYRYNSGLSGLKIVLPPEMPWAKNIYWMYTIQLNERDDMMKLLGDRGIDTRAVFCPIHLQKPYMGGSEYHPVAERISADGLNLPSGNSTTPEEVDYVIDSIKVILEREK